MNKLCTAFHYDDQYISMDFNGFERGIDVGTPFPGAASEEHGQEPGQAAAGNMTQ
jgi:hypothetical protein